MRSPHSIALALAIWAALVVGGPAAHAQDPLDKARSLYLEAAYEDALAVLDAVGSANSADGHLYRALCLIALGRSIEAEVAIARSIEIDPTATAARHDISPRVAAILADARSRMLPEMAKRRLAEGRLLFQQGDKQAAATRFATVLRLLDDAALANQADLEDLKTLASGFLDLIGAQTAASTVPASAVPAATTPPAPAPAPAAPAASPVVTRPVPIAQALPAWRRPEANSNRELRGSVRVTIDAAGRVTRAAIEESLYPGYNQALLAAARNWRYRPATRDGQPTESELIVPVLVQSR